MLNLGIGPIVAFAVLIGVIITIHELGHFLAGLIFKTRMSEFSIGFGPKIISWTWKGIEFKVCWLPLGGFVRFVSNKEPNSIHKEQKDWQFYEEKKPWMRLIISFAGPLFNALLAFGIFWVLYTTGLERWPSRVEILTHHYAEKIGLKSGDRITQINGYSVQGFEEISMVLKNQPMEPGVIQIERCQGSVCEKHDLSFEHTNLFPHDEVYEESPHLGLMPYFYSSFVAVPKHLEGDTFPLKTGDRIVAVNNQEVKQGQDWRLLVPLEGKTPLKLKIIRYSDLVSILIQWSLDKSKRKSSFWEHLNLQNQTEKTIEIEPIHMGDLLNLPDFSKSVVMIQKGEEKSVIRPTKYMYKEKEYFLKHIMDIQRLYDAHLKDVKLASTALYGENVMTGEEEIWELNAEEYKKIEFIGSLVIEESKPLISQPKTIQEAALYSYWDIKHKITSFGHLIRDLIIGDKKVKDHIGGPAAIAKLSKDAYQEGLRVFLILMASLSLNIGFINLLPFPALDGGKIVQTLIEILSGHDKLVEYEGYVNTIGFIFLFLFMIYVFYQDIMRIFFSS